MLSAVILYQCGYPAMQLTPQPEHQGLAHAGPLVLGAKSLKYPTLTPDRDRTVLRMLFQYYYWHGLYLHPLTSITDKE